MGRRRTGNYGEAMRRKWWAIAAGACLLVVLGTCAIVAHPAHAADPPSGSASSASAPSSLPVTSTVTVTVTATPTASATPTGSTPGTATVTATVTASRSSPASAAPSSAPTQSAAPAPTTTVTRAPDDTSDRTSGAALGVAVAILVLAVGGLLFYLARRGRTGARTPAAAWDASLTHLVSTARWFSDRLAADVSDRSITSTQANRSWTQSRPLVDDLARGLDDARQSAPDPSRVQRAAALAESVAALRAALEADLHTRERDEPATPDVATARERLGRLLVTPGAAPR